MCCLTLRCFFGPAELGYTAQYGLRGSAWSWSPSCNGVWIALVQRNERTSLALMAFGTGMDRPGSGVSRQEAVRQGELLSLQRTRAVLEPPLIRVRYPVNFLSCPLLQTHLQMQAGHHEASTVNQPRSRHICVLNDYHGALLCSDGRNAVMSTSCDNRGNARSAIRSAIPTASGPLPLFCLETPLA